MCLGTLPTMSTLEEDEALESSTSSTFMFSFSIIFFVFFPLALDLVGTGALSTFELFTAIKGTGLSVFEFDFDGDVCMVLDAGD